MNLPIKAWLTIILAGIGLSCSSSLKVSESVDCSDDRNRRAGVCQGEKEEGNGSGGNGNGDFDLGGGGSGDDFYSDTPGTGGNPGTGDFDLGGGAQGDGNGQGDAPGIGDTPGGGGSMPGSGGTDAGQPASGSGNGSGSPDTPDDGGPVGGGDSTPGQGGSGGDSTPGQGGSNGNGGGGQADPEPDPEPDPDPSPSPSPSPGPKPAPVTSFARAICGEFAIRVNNHIKDAAEQGLRDTSIANTAPEAYRYLCSGPEQLSADTLESLDEAYNEVRLPADVALRIRESEELANRQTQYTFTIGAIVPVAPADFFNHFDQVRSQPLSFSKDGIETINTSTRVGTSFDPLSADRYGLIGDHDEVFQTRTEAIVFGGIIRRDNTYTYRVQRFSLLTNIGRVYCALSTILQKSQEVEDFNVIRLALPVANDPGKTRILEITRMRVNNSGFHNQVMDSSSNVTKVLIAQTIGI